MRAYLVASIVTGLVVLSVGLLVANSDEADVIYRRGTGMGRASSMEMGPMMGF